ncbi:hypothetical protein ACJMK2_000426 [Sinanodonta woodiana]|uniref:Cysteine and tyrosine-rich protein 1 n=1 Tax=Sinanodonta woodiana TaxID=1069815 RepID=A0ABD3XSS7_SINWO
MYSGLIQAIMEHMVSIILLLSNIDLSLVVSGEYCQYDYTNYYSSYYSRYCSNGCCGTKYSDYSDVCCSYSISTIDLSGGAIAGIVIGSLFLIFIVICCIVACCSAANSSSRRVGTVIQPASSGMQTVVVNSTAVSQGQSTFPVQQQAQGYGYNYGVQPPPYVQQNSAPPGSSNPEYPPPPPAKY